MPASAAITARRLPIRSASAPIAGVATTLAQIAAAKTPAICCGSRPCPASHTGQNGSCTPMTRNAAALNAARRGGGPAVMSPPPQ